MHLQLAFRQTCRKRCFQGNGFRLRSTVHQPIICIPAPWEVWVLSCHPRIKCVVQEQVSQDGTDHTSLRSSASSSDPCSILKFHRCRQPSFDIQSRSRKSEQRDKWSFCLTASKISPRIRRDDEQETTPESHTKLQGQGGACRHQGRDDAFTACGAF